MTLQEKANRVHELATNIDLWVDTPMSKNKKETVVHLLMELQGKLDTLDEQYVNTKLGYYEAIYKEIKKDNAESGDRKKN